MKVKGDLTHARFAAEASRIARIASKCSAHETLRMHTGEHPPQNLVSRDDVNVFVKEITDILNDITDTPKNHRRKLPDRDPDYLIE